MYHAPNGSARRKFRGLTRIETSVVMVFSGLLAALIFPAFLAAFPPARTTGTVCQVNLKQFRLALQMYQADQEQKLRARSPRLLMKPPR